VTARHSSMIVLVGVLCHPAVGLAATCESLAERVFANSTIHTAHVVPAGQFNAPSGRANASPPSIPVPAFCRVIGRIQPTINFEVWLPTGTKSGGWESDDCSAEHHAFRFRSLTWLGRVSDVEHAE
jgi:hypothetical protein